MGAVKKRKKTLSFFFSLSQKISTLSSSNKNTVVVVVVTPLFFLSLSSDVGEARRRPVDVLLELLDLGLGPVADLRALVPLGDLDVEPGHALAVARRVAAGLLDHERERRDLEEEAELGLGGRGGDVGEDACVYI